MVQSATATGTTIAILPGFGEGDWHTRRLLKEFMRLGYTPAPDVSQADVIVTHSAGCFFLPPTTDAQHVVLIGPPFWPGQPLLIGFLRKESRYFITCLRRRTLRYWLTKTFWNTIYVLRDIPKAVRISLSARRHDFYEALTAPECSIIRNRHDDFCTPDIAQRLAGKGSFSYHELPGEHDDCWYFCREHAGFIDKLLHGNATLVP